MKTRRQFEIALIQLSEEKHHFEFDIESSFFQEFEDSFIEKGNLKAEVLLNKTSTMIQLNFQIKGQVELTCDRSLEQYDQKIEANENLILKYGEEYSELTEEIITIPRDLQKINLSQYIYEYIGLAVPMKKLHPKFQTQEFDEEMEDDEEEGILIYSTASAEDESEEESSEENDESVNDPRWEILKNIKKNLN